MYYCPAHTNNHPSKSLENVGFVWLCGCHCGCHWDPCSQNKYAGEYSWIHTYLQRILYHVMDTLISGCLFPFPSSSLPSCPSSTLHSHGNSKKSEGKTRFSLGWQSCSSGFSLGFALRKTLGEALPALEKPCPSLFF